MIMVLGPHKKKTEAMAEAREAQAARKAERQGVTSEETSEAPVAETEAAEAPVVEAEAEAPAETPEA
jgi:translation initiation factor IF-3